MSFQLSRKIILNLCGDASLKRGETYYARKQVHFTSFGPETGIFAATVRGNGSFHVTVSIDENKDVTAKCSCPTLDSYQYYCQHIAAVLLSIHHDMPQGANTQAPLATSLLSLFSEQPKLPSSSRNLFESRTSLAVQFTCSPCPSEDGHVFGIELRVGPKRLYIVQNLREFLNHVNRGQAHEVSRTFTYDSHRHSFQEADDAVIQQLIRIYRDEQVYGEMSTSAASVNGRRIQGRRRLLVPSSAWNRLLPLLLNAPSVQVNQSGRTFDGMQVSEGTLPLRFGFGQAPDGNYQLDVQGLDELVVMPSYGALLSEGNLYELPTQQCERVAELKQILCATNAHRLELPANQLEPFVDKVIPGLMQLGEVNISEAVSNRLIRTPLRAKLYLDRLKDRLLASVEFQYGDIVINPVDGHVQKLETKGILMRDGPREQRILALMDGADFVQTESGYFMEDEEAEYAFLYHVVPQLQKLMTVYATTAVSVRFYKGNPAPKINVNLDGRNDWLEFQFNIDGIPESEIKNVLQSIEEKRKYYRVQSGSFMPLESEEFAEITRFMDEVGIHSEDLTGRTARIPVVRGLQMVNTQESNDITFSESLRRLLADVRDPRNLKFTVPASLAPILRDYQKYGFHWFKTLAHYRFGGILADDMGLGKTLQSIAFIVSVMPEMRKQHMQALVVCPASLVYNWRNELRKFAPEVRAVVADGSSEERSNLLCDLDGVDVIITSYPLLRQDIQLYAAKSFYAVILDEAQVFKNYTTQTAQAVKRVQSTYRFALTGTPVENSLEELWSIFHVVCPGVFPDRKAFSELSRESIAKRIRPFLLRRLKTDVLSELPEKIESVQSSELLPDQKRLYVAYLSKLQQETVKHLNRDTFRKNRIRILAGLTRLRQLCCHPALFVEGYAGGSAKFDQLMEVIEECRSAGKRMLVFSQFTQMLSIIKRELAFRGLSYFYLDGDTPVSERVPLCDRFNDGERDLFLISLKAGGTGLNLTGADTVILYDMWWNPAVETQAADRAHRIGQKNVVQVIRLVAQGTVEDKMYELQQKKKDLIDEVIESGGEAPSTLSEQDIREILMV